MMLCAMSFIEKGDLMDWTNFYKENSIPDAPTGLESNSIYQYKLLARYHWLEENYNAKKPIMPEEIELFNALQEIDHAREASGNDSLVMDTYYQALYDAAQAMLPPPESFGLPPIICSICKGQYQTKQNFFDDICPECIKSELLFEELKPILDRRFKLTSFSETEYFTSKIIRDNVMKEILERRHFEPPLTAEESQHKLREKFNIKKLEVFND